MTARAMLLCVKKLVVLRSGPVIPEVSARLGEFAGWIQREVGSAWGGPWDERDLRRRDDLPELSALSGEVAGFIITGSSGSVTERAPWMLEAEAYLREVVEAEVPVFGICFGHQILAQALGGEVVKGGFYEVGTVEVRVRPHDPRDVMFEGMPDRFLANGTHRDTVARPPPGARVLAETDVDACTAMSIGETTRSVQYHPEMNGEAMRGYIDTRGELIASYGQDARAVREAVVDDPVGSEVLRTFVRHIVVPRSR